MKIHQAQLQDATNRAASLQGDGIWQMAPATTDGQERIHQAQLQDTTNRAASLQVDGVWQMAPATTAGQERASANHTADLTRSKRWGDQEQG